MVCSYGSLRITIRPKSKATISELPYIAILHFKEIITIPKWHSFKDTFLYINSEQQIVTSDSWSHWTWVCRVVLTDCGKLRVILVRLVCRGTTFIARFLKINLLVWNLKCNASTLSQILWIHRPVVPPLRN